MNDKKGLVLFLLTLLVGFPETTQAQGPAIARAVRPFVRKASRKKPITVEAVTRQHLNFNGSPISVQGWLEDGEHFLQAKSDQLLKVQARTNRSEPFLDYDKLASALAALPPIGKDKAKSLARRIGMAENLQPWPPIQTQINPRRAGALFEHDGDLYYAAFDGSQAIRLTKSKGHREYATFSPNGQLIAFVRDHNLYVVDIGTQTEKALTTEGTALLSHGKPDWVYGEEIFSYQKAFWWSPDSSHLVFIRFDDKPVHKFTVIDQIPPRQTVEATPYPKAGDPNPLVKVGVVAAAGGPVQWLDLGSYPEADTLVIRAGWLPDSQQVFCYVQDRAQTWLDFCTAPRQGGSATRLFRETTKAWVEDPGEPKFLKDGSFLFFSERSGWKHLYHYDKSGKLIRPITAGDWEVRALHLVDEAAGWVYVSGTRDSPIASNLYRVRLDGSAIERLTCPPGEHGVKVSPKGNLFIDSCSSHARPIQVLLYSTEGSLQRVLDANPVPRIDEYQWGQDQLVQIPLPDGFVLEGSLLTPPDFDPKRRYPVWFKTYGGPHAPTISDSWNGGRVHDQMLAQLGFIVFRCDPRSASGKGACSTWTAYRRMGVQELRDIESAIGWLTQHPFVDASRIGMSGHSYGGFLTAFAMTHSKVFAAGIAGAPVTDWRTYDTIYTERYMSTPRENPEGYNATSVVKAAGNLHGKLLLLHGLMDDNVHFQNSAQLIEEFQKAGKTFEVMLYPRSRHGIHGQHHQRLVLEFMKRALRPDLVQKRAGLGP